MSKVWLEEIKRMKLHAIEHHDKTMLKIIEQAERAKELEIKLHGNDIQLGYKRMYDQCNKDYAKLLQQNKRYRKTLEFYADEETYKEIKHEAVYQGGIPIEPPSGEPPLIYYDKGKEARKALERESE